VNSDGFIDFDELKRMMEQMGEPQTHLSLKSMIAQVDDDDDNRINLREFLRIFQMSVNGQLADNSGLRALADRTTCDVTKEGVVGAADFFQSKV
jgi:predicted DNA-binding ribbon-helix-helix protein